MCDQESWPQGTVDEPPLPNVLNLLSGVRQGSSEVINSAVN